MSHIKLPLNPTPDQVDTYNKNWELHRLACINKNRFGVLTGMCASLGVEDTYLWDANRFVNVYPYCSVWYELAYGKKYNDDINTYTNHIYTTFQTILIYTT